MANGKALYQYFVWLMSVKDLTAQHPAIRLHTAWTEKWSVKFF